MGTADLGRSQALYFFLSYARADSIDDPYLRRFFQDLGREVRLRSGRPNAEDVGFLDVRSIRPGEAWSRELSSALAGCRTFIALCSPAYFNSDNCGREWSVFADRVRKIEAGQGWRPPALLPVIWTPVRTAPDVMTALQYDHLDLGATYAEFGLRYLLQLKRNHDEYQEFLRALSDRVVRLAEDTPLPPADTIAGFEEIRSAFDVLDGLADQRPSGLTAARPEVRPDPARQERDRMTATATGAAAGAAEAATEPAEAATEPAEAATVPAAAVTGAAKAGPGAPPGGAAPGDSTRSAGPWQGGSGPKHVTFVVAVTSANELASVRECLDYYGARYDEWMPYRPRYTRRVCSSAQAVAGQQDMTSKIVMLHAGIGQVLDSAKAKNEIVVFLVDVWTASMEPYRGALTEYDRRNEPTTGVLVPWNADDVETDRHADKLIDALARALPNNMLRQDQFFRTEIRSYEEFQEALVQILADTQARIFAQSRVLRRGSSTPRPRPVLEGP